MDDKCQFYDNLRKCTKCNLHQTRKQVVIGEGNDINPEILFVGEAPGKMEDFRGRPFIGKAGQTLRLCLKEVGVDLSKVYFTNVLLCRPTLGEANRPPEKSELKACKENFDNIVHRLKPKMIIALGSYPIGVLEKSKRKVVVGNRRGIVKWNVEYNCFVAMTYHPSFVNRKSFDKRVRSTFINDLKYFVKFNPNERNEKSSRENDWMFVDTEDKLNDMCDKLLKSSVVAFDVEATGLNHEIDHIVGISFYTLEGDGYYVPIMDLKINQVEDSEDEYEFVKVGNYDDTVDRIKSLFKFFTQNNTLIVGQNLIYDIKMMWVDLKISVGPHIFDTMIAHHIIEDEGNGTHSLANMTKRYKDIAGYKSKFKEEKSDVASFIIKYGIEEFVKYGISDSMSCIRLYKEFDKKLGKRRWLFEEVMMPIVRTIVRMELRGLSVDCGDYTKELSENLTKEIEEEKEKIFGMLGYSLNLNSPVQVTKAIYLDMGIPPENPTDGGRKKIVTLLIKERNLSISKENAHKYIGLFKEVCEETGVTDWYRYFSSNEETLDRLKEKYGNRVKIVDHLLNFRGANKALSTYVDKIPLMVGLDGRIHPSFHPARTVTGRLSSSDPNVQQIPRDSLVKGIIIPREGNVFFSADYKQLEMFIVAWYSQDPALLEAIRDGIDIHTSATMRFYDILESAVTEDKRYIAKTIGFAILYGGGAGVVSSVLGCSMEEASKLIKRYFSIYRHVKIFMDRCSSITKKNSCLASEFGRIRRLPEILSSDEIESRRASRQAGNFIVQSTANDVVLYHASRVDDQLVRYFRGRKDKYDTRFLGTVNLVHDEILSEIPDKEEDRSECKKIVLNEMVKQVGRINIPLKVSWSWISRWGSKSSLYETE